MSTNYIPGFIELTPPTMELRDYFAGKAMQAVVTTNPDCEDEAVIAKASYLIADAMLAARATSQESGNG
jgi:hypothetical protein